MRKFEEQVIESDSVISVNTNCCYPWNGLDAFSFYGLKHFQQNDAGAVAENQNKRLHTTSSEACPPYMKEILLLLF